MSSTPDQKNKQKVMFVITKANWGEKWVGVKNDRNHSLRGCLLFLEKIATTCTGPVRTHFARLIEVFFELAKKKPNEWTASVRRRQAAPQHNYLSYGHTK